MSDKKPTHEIPDDVIESFARCLLPSIRPNKYEGIPRPL